MSMRAIVHTGPDTLELWQVALPEPGDGEVRIRTACVGICATDLEMIAGWERTQPPSIPGHEWSGTVESVGPGVAPHWIGRRVVAENVRRDGGEVGFEHAGAYGECFITDAANLLVLPDALSFEAAVLIEPLAVCVRGLRRLRLNPACPTLIIGDGPIGLLTCLLLKRAGVTSVAMVGGRDARMAMAKALGANPVIDFRQTAERIRELVGSRPQIIEATGSQAAIETALALAPKGGRVLVLGDYASACAAFPWNTLLHRELELVGSNASAEAWPEAVLAASELDEKLRLLVSRCLPAAQYADAMAQMRSGTPDFIKLVLDWR